MNRHLNAVCASCLLNVSTLVKVSYLQYIDFNVRGELLGLKNALNKNNWEIDAAILLSRFGSITH